jgi:hypothetical protein
MNPVKNHEKILGLVTFARVNSEDRAQVTEVRAGGKS